MPEMISSAAQTSAKLLKETQMQLQGVGEHCSARMTEAIAAGVKEAQNDLLKMREAVLKGVAEQAQGVLAQSASRFREAMEPLGKSFGAIAADLANVMSDGKQIVSLQHAMRENVEQLARLHSLDKSFGQLQVVLDNLGPILDKLSRPVPLRLSLGGSPVPGNA